jgi:putative transposase
MFEIAEYYGWDILEYNDDLDHIHMLVSYQPKYSISNIVKLFKQISTYRLWSDQENVKILKRFFYGEKKLLWSNGYFACSIGNASKETISKYIEQQG